MECKKELKFWKMITQIQITIFAALTAITLIMNIKLVEKENETLDLFKQQQELEIQSDSLRAELDSLHVLSWKNIEYWIDTLGIEHKEIVMQQIALETGMLTSNICRENNNLFGMKQARVRETTALGTKRGHAYYSSYIESIKDYKLWQDNMYDGGDYYVFLDRIGYAENMRYASILKSI
jgi:uncharacterized FlgJ-related protein